MQIPRFQTHPLLCNHISPTLTAMKRWNFALISLVHAALNVGLTLLFIQHAYANSVVGFHEFPMPLTVLLIVSFFATCGLNHFVADIPGPKPRFTRSSFIALTIVTILVAVPIYFALTHTTTEYTPDRIYEIEHRSRRHGSFTERIRGASLNRRDEIFWHAAGYAAISGWLALVLYSANLASLQRKRPGDGFHWQKVRHRA